MYKKSIVCIALLFLAALPVSAATIETGEEYSLVDTEIVEGDLYVAGGNINISGEVRGDLVTAGGNILVNGTVGSDITVAGGNIDVLGTVGDDIRLAGGQIRIGDAVAGDVVLAGGYVQILSSASVLEDLIVVGGRVVVDGDVKGDVTIYASEVEINGILGGDVELFISEKVAFGDSAEVVGTLTYSAPHEATVDEGAIFNGTVSFNETRITKDIETFLGALFGLFFITKIIALLTIGLLAVLVLRKFSDILVTQAINNLGSHLLRGLIVLIVTPVLLFFFFVATIGFFVGALGSLLFLSLLLLAYIYAGIIFGALLSKWVHKEVTLNWQWTIVGITLLQLIGLIPFVGPLFVFIALLVSLGVLSHLIYHHIWLNRV